MQRGLFGRSAARGGPGEHSGLPDRLQSTAARVFTGPPVDRNRWNTAVREELPDIVAPPHGRGQRLPARETGRFSQLPQRDIAMGHALQHVCSAKDAHSFHGAHAMQRRRDAGPDRGPALGGGGAGKGSHGHGGGEHGGQRRMGAEDVEGESVDGDERNVSVAGNGDHLQRLVRRALVLGCVGGDEEKRDQNHRCSRHRRAS